MQKVLQRYSKAHASADGMERPTDREMCYEN